MRRERANIYLDYLFLSLSFFLFFSLSLTFSRPNPDRIVAPFSFIAPLRASCGVFFAPISWIYYILSRILTY